MFARIFRWCQGRHTAFAIFFTIVGSALAWHQRLDMSYVALVTAIQGWVFAHSYKEDKFKDGGQDGDSK